MIHRLLQTFALAVSLLCAECAAAGKILRVGPQRAYQTIQQAVNAAAEGDLILVDAGLYAPFEVLAKGVAILSANPAAPFTMVPDRQRSVVRVRLLAAHQCVTIMGWQTAVQYGAFPPLAIDNCAGCVRIRDAVLDQTTDLGDELMRAVVDIDKCVSVSFYDVSVWSNTPRRGRWSVGVSAPGGVDHGLAAMVCRDSSIHLQRCRLRGYDDLGSPSLGRWGGDGLRLLSPSLVRIDDSVTQLLGGAGGEFGGSAIQVLVTSGFADVLACAVPTSAFARGAGPKPGGSFAHNHDRGLVAVGVERFVPSCLLESYGAVRAPGRWPINQQSTVEVMSFFARNFALVGGPTRIGGLRGYENGLHLDLASPWTLLLTVGVLPANQASRVNFRLPNLVSLAGLQVGLQAALGPPQGQSVPAGSLTLAEMVVITP